jgi:hypothetical protein
VTSVLFKNVLNNLFRHRLLRCEEEIINNGIIAISHRQWIWNELEACHFSKSLLITFHDRNVVLFDKLRPGKKVGLVALSVSSISPRLITVIVGNSIRLASEVESGDALG